MKSNYLTLKTQNGNKKEYRILLNIESNEENKNFVIYTDDKKNKDGNIRAYASSYILSEKGNMTKLKNVSNKDELDFINKILDSLIIKK